MRTGLSAFVAAGLLLAAGPAAAGDMQGPACGAFTLIRSFDRITFTDNNARGVSPGDVRVLSGPLSDADGNRVGAIYIVATVVAAGGADGQDLTSAVIIDRFPNGTITSTTLTAVPAADDQTRGAADPSHRAVVGGTGAFAGVTGTITGSTNAEGQREIAYDLTCPPA